MKIRSEDMGFSENQGGFSLLELLIGICLLSIAIMGMATLQSTGSIHPTTGAPSRVFASSSARRSPFTRGVRTAARQSGSRRLAWVRSTSP